jgi:hypothetical protein
MIWAARGARTLAVGRCTRVLKSTCATGIYRLSLLSITAYYHHTLSVRGTDNPSSRYHPLRFCLSAIPTCRYPPLLDIAFHALHTARYQILGASGVLGQHHGTFCRQMSHVEPEQNRVAVVPHVCSVLGPNLAKGVFPAK